FLRGYIRDTLDRVQHGLRPDAAIEAKDVCSPFFQTFCENFRRRAFETIAVLFDRHLRDQRAITDIPYAANCRIDLIQIEECFQNESIDATVEQCLSLFSKDHPCLFDRGLAPWFDADSERTDRSGDEYFCACDLSRDPRSLDVD